MEDGGEADLGVDHAIDRHVFDEFKSDPLKPFLGLHDGDGVSEAFKIFGEVSALGSPMEPLRELGFVLRGESFVAEFLREFDDGLRAEAAIEVFVEEDLWETFEIESGG